MLLWKPPIDGQFLEPLLDGHPPPAAAGSLVEESEPSEPGLCAGRHPSHLRLGIRPPCAARALACGADSEGIPESDLDAGVSGEETPCPARCIVWQRLGGNIRLVHDDALELMALVVAPRGVHGLMNRSHGRRRELPVVVVVVVESVGLPRPFYFYGVLGVASIIVLNVRWLAKITTITLY